MSSEPVVSVLIPAYNQPELLARTLSSTLEQTLQQVEVLVVDDSTDDAVSSLVASLPDPRIRYHRNDPPLGPAGNWNAALDAARGNYIKFLHHDDWFEDQHSLQRFVDVAETTGRGFVFSASRAVALDGTTRTVNRPVPEITRALNRDPSVILQTGNVIGGPSSTMFARKGDTTRFDTRLKWLVDIDFYISYLRRHPGLSYVDELLINTTTGSGHQVTAESEHNAAVELIEWDTIYRKHRPGAITDRLTKLRRLSREFESLPTESAWLSALPLSARLAMRAGVVERRLRGHARAFRRTTTR